MSGETTAFAASGEDAITRTIDVQLDTTTTQLSPSEFEDFYEIKRTVAEIVDGAYKRIALQFPDELLHVSVPIYRRLKGLVGAGRELYVLADTSYGSCCVDEVAAQHVDADAMVHYGYACMTQTSRLPVIYVFGKKEIDPDRCVASVLESFKIRTVSLGSNEGTGRPAAVILSHDVAYTHRAEDMHEKFKLAFEPLGISVLYNAIPTSSKPRNPSSSQSPSEQSQHPPPDVVLENSSSSGPPASHELPISMNIPTIYIGGESLGLTNLLMTHGLSDVYSYNPLTDATRLESSRTNKLLMRRYATVQKARDADVFGILVGTLGVASYLPLIKHLRTLLARNRRKSYTISVGKLNPSKLANFLEIECFVLVACPENSLIDSKDFFRPIVTPYELEVALRSEQSWTGKYVLDFEQLLKEHHAPEQAAQSGNECDEDEGENDPDRPAFSLVTGTYRHAKRYGEESSPDIRLQPDSASALILRNQDSAVAKIPDSAAAQFLHTRGYQGLEMRLGEDEPSVLEEGRSGIARGYGDDHRGE